MVGEVHHRVPVVGGDLVLAGTEVIADRALDQLSGRWPGHFGDGQAVGAEQAIDGIGGQGGQEFAFGIGTRSSSAEQIKTGRGAIRAINSCWSTGNLSSWPLYWRKLVQNQCGNDVLICWTVSPKMRRDSAAPPHPD